jgi:hypothetical protein
MKYWFRICFEKEFEDENQAQYFVNDIINENFIDATYDIEEQPEPKKAEEQMK